ncbi:PAS domain S-box-containing protein [Desulfocicer vacuolatum DSM 3385]|uniref:PAS domain S-box-containing protein n=1 Tax=Desulfocicer vacuolatum DSM 3385 TaxID=1121400 RepID=A0A1W1YKV2_9BACT|nr:sigma 54-interacting transcriptional regulator [Desulfocicer vacuolatum]SMC36860.1 PAS domain S-box-containing protein [Desulfocicer vacuolatum DSM 3385]
MKTHKMWDIHFFNQILDTMADGLFTLDSHGQITSWNRAMEDLTGYTAKEALGKGCNLLQCNRCFGKDCPSDMKKCGVLKHGTSESKECHVRHRDGYDVPVIKSARAVRDENDTLLGIVETLTNLTELNRMKKKAQDAERRLGEIHALGNIIGKSRGMQDVFYAITAAADSRATVLIQGESGTGKELVAGAIHYNGQLSQGPFIPVNCAALSETLLESELFGHIKGAFTGAHRDRKGRFEEAHGGTIFLDEIGELSPYMQVKLLRVLQEREIQRVGESRKIKINIRILAATHKDLYRLTREGQFREDLYYRLKVFPIHIPPLKSRREDIPLLVRKFIDKNNDRESKKIKDISRNAMAKLMEYPWPGNVRELENAIEHAFVLCPSQQIQTRDLPIEVREKKECLEIPPSGSESPMPATAMGAQPKLNRENLITLLHECGWNKAEVGRRMGKSRTSVWKYMKKWHIPLQPETK